MELREDQEEYINNVSNAFRLKHKSVLLNAPTGSGKTVMACEMVKRARERGKKSWFILPRKELLKQTSNTFFEFNIHHGFINSLYKRNPLANVEVCSINTLANRIRDGVIRTAPDFAILDEAHYGSTANDVVIDFLKEQGCYILGLSATPTKMSGQGLNKWFEYMVKGRSIRWYIDNNILSDYKLYRPSKMDLSGLHTLGGDYNSKELDELASKDRFRVGSAIECYKKYAMGKLAIAYGVSIRDSLDICDKFIRAGIPAVHIDGSQTDDDRAENILKFAKREALVLCNCDLATFGFDLSSQVNMDVTIEAMFDLAPTKSIAKQKQKNGRVLRYKPFPALIFDHAGNSELDKHGIPCADVDWTLEGKKKRGSSENERTIPVRQCPNCFFVHNPSTTCPDCGFIYPIISRDIEEIEGELLEVDIKAEKKKKRMEVGMAKTIADLQRIASERGYAKGWVYTQMKIKGIRS